MAAEQVSQADQVMLYSACCCTAHVAVNRLQNAARMLVASGCEPCRVLQLQSACRKASRGVGQRGSGMGRPRRKRAPKRCAHSWG
jgi:hypothetical protein